LALIIEAETSEMQKALCARARRTNRIIQFLIIKVISLRHDLSLLCRAWASSLDTSLIMQLASPQRGGRHFVNRRQSSGKKASSTTGISLVRLLQLTRKTCILWRREQHSSREFRSRSKQIEEINQVSSTLIDLSSVERFCCRVLEA
jgi:hypothetical protein